MKNLMAFVLMILSVNVFAVTLRCSVQDDISALVSYNELYCRGGGESYDVTIWGVGANFRDVEDYADRFVISCPGQDDPVGSYYGARLGGGIIVGGEGSAFVNIFEGVCTLRGVSMMNGISLEGARMSIVRR